ncbi:putative dehydrogenase [Halalkaliarchaeum sp. AArc-CO]|uniref:Gfo/Idh/MocA family protein n=1 Tax=Halalkaliarchaeum sp. AArc-CO TaxID=2866381 RepID=UPI00217D63FE|nr:Gfo/Idh/MocA family oxidoreductase [Halalkaliarchaeum sp. AArc-CO]UWG50273.1 putative dehydrogenase [Halalkaliarchaeum sp. AArc-CO]
MSLEDVRVGVVGLGGIGTHHAERLRESDAQLVGGMDIDADARTEFAQRFDVPTDGDVDELLERVDAVLVTTPNRFHEEYAVRALEMGTDVLLEKPLAHTLESAERIADAAAEADGFCMVGFHNRFAGSTEVFKHYQREGRFGDLTHVEANFLRRRGIPGRGSWFTDLDVAGGGALVDVGVHALDLALHLLDDPTVVEVSGQTRAEFGTSDEYAFVEMWGEDCGPGGFDVEDSATAFLRTADGATISLEVAWAANRPDTREMFVRGIDAGASFDLGSDELTMYEADPGGGNHLADTEITTQSRDAYAAEQRAFLEAVAAGEPPARNTVEEGLQVQRIVDAIYRSAEAGRSVRLD